MSEQQSVVQSEALSVAGLPSVPHRCATKATMPAGRALFRTSSHLPVSDVRRVRPAPIACRAWVRFAPLQAATNGAAGCLRVPSWTGSIGQLRVTAKEWV